MPHFPRTRPLFGPSSTEFRASLLQAFSLTSFPPLGAFGLNSEGYRLGPIVLLHGAKAAIND